MGTLILAAQAVGVAVAVVIGGVLIAALEVSALVIALVLFRMAWGVFLIERDSWREWWADRNVRRVRA